MSEVRILGIGVATMDIYVGKKRMYPGGNEYNVAYNAKVQGAEAGFLGVFADDLAGEILERTLWRAALTLPTPITSTAPAATAWLS